MRKITTITLLLLFSFMAQAQMTVSTTAPYNSATYLVNNVLLGNGVTASNITFSGQAAQIGFFSAGKNGVPNIGIDSGLVISSGNVIDLPPGGFQPSQGQYAGPGDPDLLTIAQSVTTNPAAGNITSTNDAAFLEFDFTPVGDSIKFNFVFASEEYTTYINTVYNDIFAFLISGPGITGPYASPAGFPNGAINIASVPGTSTPITISSIHPGLNSQYYISNSTETNNEFNGFTTVISIAYPVQCGQLYHFKIAVADCQDDWLDTGVFLEGSSFTSDELVQVDVTTVTGDSTIIEGCAGAVLNFHRPDTNGLYTVHFDIGGNAINGVDYNPIFDSVTFLPGDDTTNLVITPISDGLTEGVDTIIITVYTVNACGDTNISTGVIYILDLPDMQTYAPDTTLNCPYSTLQISASASGAAPPFTYQWTNSQGAPIGNTQTITVQGLHTDTFYVSITDSCNLVTITDTVILTLNIPELILNAPNDTLICPGDTVTLTAFGSGGSPGYNYTWIPGGNTQSITVSPATTTSYIIAMTDQCNTITMFDTVEVNNDYTPMTVNIPALQSVCTGEQLFIDVNVSNGRPPMGYTWNDGLNTYSGSDFYYPTETPVTTTLMLTVTDHCGYQEMGSVDVEVIACEIVIPNVITPNGDGSNDFLVFENLEYYPNNKLVVFNRWGKVVYEKDGYQNNWDGDKYTDGTYFFILELGNKDNTTYKGTLNILR
ncbi:MAG: gliding motility-associated C-terminal domain-containing protein [Flavobacteriales bacterium]|nr:gliding motility-associated C-terminal domain-containing protein [Flavobacteriales bacterium]